MEALDQFFDYEVSGDLALFTTPNSKVSGDKTSYKVPTYQSLIGLTEAIYWKPTIAYRIEKVRIMNRIRQEEINMLIPDIASWKKSRAIYSYLKDVRYQVRVHMMWNPEHPELKADRDPIKHVACFRKYLKSGGRWNPYLGTSECKALVRPCVFGTGTSYYDNSGKINEGIMYHSLVYPDAMADDIKPFVGAGKNIGMIISDEVAMENGVIHFRTLKEIPSIYYNFTEFFTKPKKEYKRRKNLKPVEKE